LTKTESMPTQKSSMQHNFTTDADIISAYGPQLTQKSLMKTESVSTQKSSMQHNFTADIELLVRSMSLLIQKSSATMESFLVLLLSFNQNIPVHFSRTCTCNS